MSLWIWESGRLTFWYMSFTEARSVTAQATQIARAKGDKALYHRIRVTWHFLSKDVAAKKNNLFASPANTARCRYRETPSYAFPHGPYRRFRPSRRGWRRPL